LTIALVTSAAETLPCADAEAHISAGRSLHAQHKYDGAIREFRQAATLCPQNHQALLEMVQSELASDESKAAEKHAREYLKLEPGSETARFFLAFSIYRQHRYPDAARASVELIRRAPQNPNGYVLLGMSEYFLNNYSQSEKALKDGLRVQPENQEAQYFLALAQMGREHFSLARKTLQQLIEKNPNSYQARDKLAVCYQKSANFKAAAAEFRKSEQLAPAGGEGSDAPFADHAALLLDEQQAREAVPLAREAVRRDPRNPMNEFFLGRALFEAGQTKEAIAPLQRVTSLSPDYFEGHYLLAKAEQRLGDKDAAAKEFAIVRRLQASAANAVRGVEGPAKQQGGPRERGPASDKEAN
jgi:tetratricopeptide (TPR) repeat protein